MNNRHKSWRPVFARPSCGAIAAVLLALASGSVVAQDADRERAQMLQMQQQLRKVQSDNAALQQERSQLQDKAKEAERLKGEAAAGSKEVAHLRAQVAARDHELAEARAQNEELRGQMGTQTTQWKKAIDDRDTAYQFLAAEKRKLENAMALLTVRLKAQTDRSDLCEVKHGQALQMDDELIGRLETSRLHLCDPFTGLWRVREENNIQELRQRLYDLRLDVPAPPVVASDAPAPAAATSPATAAASAPNAGSSPAAPPADAAPPGGAAPPAPAAR
jgi:uncharacterized protein YlxW (UPF0749 family)